MSATYNLFKNPGKGDNLHARQVNQYFIRIYALCGEISQISSFSSSDVKGMQEALKSRIAFHLKYGDIVERERLDTFNVSLKCLLLATEKQITPHLVRFNKVVFRCSNELKKESRYTKVERADEPNRLKGYTEEKREKQYIVHTAEHMISTFECRSINDRSKYSVERSPDFTNRRENYSLGLSSNVQYGLQEKEE